VGKFETNAIGANWWSNLEPMQVTLSGGQLCDLCEWCHQVANFSTRASGFIWWPKGIPRQCDACGTIWWQNF